MIVMSWPSATHNGMVACDTFFTKNTEPILLDFNYSDYTANSFIGVHY
jgi:hypothetical protein